jgi:hypothetical protein
LARGLFGCEHPFDAGADRIALLLPGGGLGGQLLDTLDATTEALGNQHADPISTMFNQLACFGT